MHFGGDALGMFENFPNAMQQFRFSPSAWPADSDEVPLSASEVESEGERGEVAWELCNGIENNLIQIQIDWKTQLGISN